jgi:hypothetical protein
MHCARNGLTRSYRTADQIPIGSVSGVAMLQQLRVFRETLLHWSVAHQDVHGPLWFDELDQAAALALDQFFLQHAHPSLVQAPSRFERRLNDDVQVDQ